MLAELHHPFDVIFDAEGNMYIADDGNNVVRKVTTAGIISTIAGIGTGGYSGDGGQAIAAELYHPSGIVFDVLGNLYITEGQNSRIRKVTTLGIITTIVGTGIGGYSGDGGQATAAEIYEPFNTIIDASGNLYVSDARNNRIRKVNTNGIISTYAGNGTGGLSGDGGLAMAAELNFPGPILFDAYGNMYIADTNNDAVRKISTTGIITTIAGTGTQGYSGDGGQATNAELNQPVGLAMDNFNNIYIGDYNFTIRMLNTTGIISTIVGNGTAGYSGDGGAATNAEIDFPAGVTIDALGNLYIADDINNRIRMVTNVGQTTGMEQVTNINERVTVYPNPATTSLQVSLAGNGENLTITITDMLGNAVYHSTANAAHNTIPIAEFNSGVYIIEVSNSKGAAFKKFIKE